MSISPLVSIITPTYNRGSLLEETMYSVLSQDYSPIEYIVIDDGSTDNTKEIVRKLKKRKYKNKKIIYIRQKNMGETKSVNKGLALAKGEFIAVINSDDPLLPHCVKTIVDFFAKNQEILVAYPDIKQIDEQGRTIGIGHVQTYDYSYMYSMQHCIVGQGAFIRKKGVRLIGGRSPEFKYVADFDYWLRMGLVGRFKKIPMVLVSGRQHSGSLSIAEKGDSMAEEHIRLVKSITNRLDFPKKYYKLRSAAFASAYFHASHIAASRRMKVQCFILSFLYDPITFARKERHEVARLKRKILMIFVKLNS